MQNRYPNLNLRSKNELVRRISRDDLCRQDVLALVNDCLEKVDSYWRDHASISNPEKRKWVRDASYSPLGHLHKLINRRVLSPYDKDLPSIIHGGVRHKDIRSAAKVLLGRRRKRTLLKIDMCRFYEHISEDVILNTLEKKMGCSTKVAGIIATLCCVRNGPKDQPDAEAALARGFATSSRLAVWCNLDLFCRVFWVVNKELKGHDPKMIVYVDDICITASKVAPTKMAELYFKIERLVEKCTNGHLEINSSKTKIISYENCSYDLRGNNIGYAPYETLGIQLKRNTLDIAQRTKSKLDHLKSNQNPTAIQLRSKKGIQRFRRSVRR